MPGPVGLVCGRLFETADAVYLPRIWPSLREVDMVVDPNTPGAMYLYESYTDQAAIDAHKANAPFIKFAAEVRPNCIESMDPLLFWADELGS